MKIRQAMAAGPAAKRAFVAAALAALGATAVGPALAQQGASASLHGFSYQLVDLDPADGITPYVGFNESGYYRVADLYENLDRSGPPVAEQYGLGDGISSVYNADGLASASVWSGWMTANASMDYHSGSAWASWQTDFVLSPNTQLILSVSADVYNTFGKFEGAGNASAGMWGGYWPSQSGTEMVYFDSLLQSGMGGNNHALLSAVVNAGTGGTGGSIYLDARADAWSAVSSVPEPGSAAMLLSGAALLGGVLRRRARRQA